MILTFLALIPTSKWLDSASPVKPTLEAFTDASGSVKLTWSPGNDEPVRWWLLQTRHGKQWVAEVLPVDVRSRSLKGGAPDAIALSAVDRVGNLSSASAQSLRNEDWPRSTS